VRRNNTNAKNKRQKGIVRLPHFLRKFAMTEEWIPACVGMTERDNRNYIKRVGMT